MAQATLSSSFSKRSPRVMLYSHDTFGLGHLRRSRLLATAITEADPTASALILTGSPVAGRFTFPRGVDHLRLPGVTKLADGSYASATMGTDIEATTNLRSGLIQSAAEQFDPDLLIVDKEPTGFRGELLPTLETLRAQGKAKMVLGLREVLDEPEVLASEWERKGAVEATERFYHDIWIYGLQSIYDPTQGLPLSAAARARMHWTGYLRRTVPEEATPPDEPYILVTPGGGGDGETLVDLVLQAYEKEPNLGPPAKIVYGPFLSGDTRRAFEERAMKLGGRVDTNGFESEMETLLSGAQGVICMGGYNTFCEVLSFDKPAVILPRRVPRLEQYIRASKAEELGLCRMLDEKRDGLTAEAMIAAIAALPNQRPPSAAFVDGLLDGLDTVNARVRALLADSASCAAE